MTSDLPPNVTAFRDQYHESLEMMHLHDIQKTILEALEKAGGEISVDELSALYSERWDGRKNARLVKLGYTEWVRPRDNPTDTAKGLRITEAGRHILSQVVSGDA